MPQVDTPYSWGESIYLSVNQTKMCKDMHGMVEYVYANWYDLPKGLIGMQEDLAPPPMPDLALAIIKPYTW